MNATQPSNCYNPTALRIGHTIAYCVIFIISVVGNSFIGIIVYKTKTMRKPINYLIVNMAMSDLLFPIFLIPKTVVEIHDDDWPIRGHLGEVLCKLAPFSADLSAAVSDSEPCADSSGSICSCGISPPFPALQFKIVPLLYSRHVDHRHGYIHPVSGRVQAGRI